MILITGATGNNGVEIVKKLSAQRKSVRAMVRKEPEQKDGSPAGVEYAIADFDDADSLRKALAGVDRAFLVTPSSEKVEEQQLQFVDLAREAGVKHIVYLSQLHARQDSPVRFLRYHAAVEAALAQSGMAFTNLRPNLYMQGLLLFKQLIASQGKITAPVGESPVSVVDVRDIAAVAVAALTETGHEGKSYDITGPEALTHAQMAEELAQTIGKPVTFENISGAAMREALLGFHMPGWQADGLVEDYEHYSRGEATTLSTAVQAVTGVKPRTFQIFAQDFKQAFLA